MAYGSPSRRSGWERSLDCSGAAVYILGSPLEDLMGASKGLADLLRANLDSVQRPEGYDDFRAKLRELSEKRLRRAPPSINESPENLRPLDDIEGIAKGTAGDD